MSKPDLTRRSFMRGAVGAAALTGLAAAAAAETETKPDHAVRLGGPVFVDAGDPEALALAHRNLRYAAAYCPDIRLDDRDRIRAVAEAFSRHNVTIAEVGRWCNMMDADPDKRRKNIAWVAEGLALADAVGALCCVNIAGSFNTEIWFGPHPKNITREFFDAAVENARFVIDAAKPTRAKFTYEMMGWSLPDSVDSCLEMIKAVERPAFGVHLDPCNLINSPTRFYNNAALINDCFDRLGPHIVSCHAKDLTWEVEMNIHFRQVRPGTGSLEYPVYLRRLAQLPHRPPLLLEHLATPEEYDAARLYLLELGASLGVTYA